MYDQCTDFFFFEKSTKSLRAGKNGTHFKEAKCLKVRGPIFYADSKSNKFTRKIQQMTIS